MIEKSNENSTLPISKDFTPDYRDEKEPMVLPMMPLRGMLVYPYMIIHIDVGRERSIKAIDEAMLDDSRLLFLAMQKNPQTDDPIEDEIYNIGTVVQIRQLLKLPGGTVRLLVEGLYRAHILAYTRHNPYYAVEIESLDETLGADELEMEAIIRITRKCFEDYASSSKKITPEALISINGIEEPERFADIVAAQLNLKYEDRQRLLEETDIYKRMEMIISMLDKETQIIDIEKKIVDRVRQQMEKHQKEYYLREQMKAIQQELGEKDERTAEVEELRARALEQKVPDHVMEQIEKELDRLLKMPSQMAEGSVISTYINWLLDVPWNQQTKDNLDIHRAEKILNQDHYGLEKPKERILEYLASRQLTNNLKGPILCLVGPPGVGKTSLARSVARAMDRNFVRMSLGGVHDEAEIRGHRRTYIGAMPGRIMQNIKQAKSCNPLFLLDEIDKLSNDFRGDPSSALLEVLDPEQNNTFVDHYLEVPYDLSNVLFITTANVRYDIPKPLQDRMEIIEISSYTEEEKVKIAARHLVAKQLAEHGLDKKQLSVSENALRAIIRYYTREAGVRELERLIARICRHVSRDIVGGVEPPFKVTEANIEDYLGMHRFHYGSKRQRPQVGVAIGMAWTQVGGELLEIEVQTLTGKGKITITGQLGDVMKESVQAGYTYIRSIGKKLGIADNIEDTTDFHIHVPEGAIPKDGPSAGITMATAIASQLSGRRVRSDLAMTGEVTLRGRVLPVGGIKEKLLAAYRSGIKEIILPLDNEKDLEDLPSKIRSKMKFNLVETMDDVLDIALLP